jgi:para-aminobenzoate synthetase component 1
MGAAPFVQLEHGPAGRPARFTAARDILVARTPAEVVPALARLDAGRADGLWVAGWVAYEAAAAFEPRLAHVARGPGPLLVMGLFDGPAAPEAPPSAGAGALLSLPRPAVGRAGHQRAVGRLRDWIAAGDSYQVNLTFPLRARLLRPVAPLALYGRLAAAGPVGHGAVADLGVGPAVVSLSPELFVRADAQGAIVARPMKGTAPRDADPARDRALAAALRASEKGRAENLMIVDLLRNDISRLAVPGSVRVPELFRLEPYATVHQMTSTVVGRLAAPASLSRLLPALFPCGSVTGAPKIRSMEIIREIEPHPRGVYCGAVGWMGPDGSCDFSVAIRTLVIRGDEVTVGVGGGVVWDSTAQGEWEEALWKSRFLGPALG